MKMKSGYNGWIESSVESSEVGCPEIRIEVALRTTGLEHKCVRPPLLMVSQLHYPRSDALANPTAVFGNMDFHDATSGDHESPSPKLHLGFCNYTCTFYDSYLSR